MIASIFFQKARLMESTTGQLTYLYWRLIADPLRLNWYNPRSYGKYRDSGESAGAQGAG